MTPEHEPVWPVDLGEVRLWPMEGEDGPLLQEPFDDLADFRTAFGEPGSADAVSTLLALPEGETTSPSCSSASGKTAVWLARSIA